MTSYVSVLRDNLQALGWPAHLLDSITQHVKGDDIIGLGVRLALIGLMASIVRVFFLSLKAKFTQGLFPTAYVAVEDPAFEWIHTFLAQDPSVIKQMKSFRLMSSDERQSQKDDAWRHSKAAKKEGLALSKRDASWTTDSVVAQLLPVDGQSLRLTFDGKPIWVTRQSKGYARNLNSDSPHLQIKSLVWHPDVMRDFILAAHKVFYHKEQGELMIHNASPYNGAWLVPITRPARDWNSVILPQLIKEDLLKDIQGFLSEKEKKWYAARGIPHRRGYLLYGPPGSGKTTLATAIASHLRLDLYCINPAARGMDDGKIHKMFRNVAPGSLILIEDIDCVLPARQRVKRDFSSDDEDEDDKASAAAQADPGKFGLAVSTVTLSGLLNAIDGVASQEDSVLLASTNHPEKLDEALKRPGRFDVHVQFHDAVSSQITDLYKHFYPLAEYSQPQGASLSPLKHTEDEKTIDTTDHEGEGFEHQVELDEHASKLAQVVMDTGADVSMAALQGYLLRYKKNPKKAVEDAGAWASGLKEEQDEKARKKEEKRKERENRKAALLPPTPVSEP